ncbi:hypothetical protein ACQ4PT_021944 [Festuca glaucescens]
MDRTIKPGTTAATESIWSMLPGGAVMEIGGHVLGTGDVDYYVNMRAAFPCCHAAMDDPKEHPTDPRFLLRQWIMLEEESPGDGRLFLNTDTGRFLRVELPGLTGYYFIISTGGLLVLATREPPHMVRVVNPFTPSCIKFKAPIPDFLLHTTACLRLAGTTPTLVLQHPSGGDMAYSATPDNEHFVEVKYDLLDKAHDIWGITDGMVDDLVTRHIKDRSWEKYHCYYFLQSAGEMLLVLGRKDPGHGMDVFKVNFQQKVIEPTRNIGSRALFLGDRCVSVDAAKIPFVHSNCVFYRDRGQHGRDGIYKYDLTTEKEEQITSDVTEILLGITAKPLAPSMIQLLVNYCTNTPWSQLENERCYGQFQEEHMEE